ncbi:MAG: NUDIX domain-containing protein [Bacilli bacterium]|nr:NUDIX domain-containing protein [Bacilli bacterium]
MKEISHLGVYGIILEDKRILLIKKNGGPYDGKLDLPGGTIEFIERPEETLFREIEEEVGIKIINYALFDVDSINYNWKHKGDLLNCKHIGIFYLIDKYDGVIKNDLKIDNINDDSKGAEFYKIENLKKYQLSEIAILELEKFGYKILN